jgi:membrane protease subunit HflK
MNQSHNGLPQKSLGVLIGVAVLLIYLASGVYTVNEGEQAVITRLGAYQETKGAGLRYHWPYPFEEAFVRNVAVNNHLSSDERRSDIQREQNDYYMLTGDENLLEVSKYIIHWRIKDLRKFLFNVRAPEVVLIAAADSSLREIIAKTPINLLITERRAQVNEEVTQLLQAILDRYDSGIQIVEFLMQKADPPEPVMDAFIDVTRAEADRERSQHEAKAYHDEILPKARAKARNIVLDAQGYANQVIARSEGEAGQFAALYKEYAKSPQGTRVRLYMEMLEDVLSGAQKMVVDPSSGAPVHGYLPLPELAKKHAKIQTEETLSSPKAKVVKKDPQK